MTNFDVKEINILKNCTLLTSLAESHIQALMSISSRVTFEKGEILLNEGDFCEDFFIIISGSVELYKKDEETSEQELIGSLKGGETIGEMRIIQNRACSLTVKAEEPIVALRTSISQLRAVENHHCYEAILSSIIRIINDRLFHSNETILYKISEKRKKTKQLIFSLFSIIVLVLFLGELSLALYYATNPSHFCNDINLNQARYLNLGK